MQPDERQYAMRRALPLGVFLIVKFFVSLLAMEPIPTAMTLFVPYMIYMAQRRYCVEFETTYEMSYWKLVRYGFSIFFYASMLLALAHFIYFQIINPLYLSQLTARTMESIEQMNLPEETLKLLREQPTLTPMQMTIGSWVLNSIIGFFLSVVTAVFAQKR